MAVEGACNNTTLLEYNTTPPVFPVNFEITELDYRGSYEDAQKIHLRH